MEIMKFKWLGCYILKKLLHFPFSTVSVVQLHQSGPQSIRVKYEQFCGHLIQEVTAIFSLATQKV